MRTKVAIRSLLFSLIFVVCSHAAFAQIGIGISVNFGPPALPVYEQPICPAEGYMWTPGYWAWDGSGYYWVPGTWVMAPRVGFLWTPGWWGWGGGAFLFHEGYWGPHVGFYGGINYGFGYGGVGYGGGRWEGGHFAYNTYVNHVNTTIIHNTYNTTVVNNVTENHVSYNGGEGGLQARPTAEEESYGKEQHVGPVAAQTQHVEAARNNPQLRASANHGVPPIAATAKPGDFKSGAVASSRAGGEYKAPPANEAHGAAAAGTETHGNEAAGTEGHGTETAPKTYHDASELQPHKYTAPTTGNADTDKKYQAQQDQLAAKQAQDHAKLQQQQEKQHQQATQKNYNDQQKQQLEQKHAQQTQQLEQKHATQQTKMQQHQTPHESSKK